jgi:hypothetical protein
MLEHIGDCALPQLLLHRRLSLLVMPEQTLLDVSAHGTLRIWAFAVERENHSGPDKAIHIRQ